MVELEIKPSGRAQLRVLAILTTGTVLLAWICFLLSGGGADLLSRKASVTGYLPDATGVAPTSEVHLNGLIVGSVTAVRVSGSLDPLKAIRVDMRITSRYLKNIPADSLVGIGSDTLVAYKFISIAQGKSTATLADGGELQSEPLQDALFRADLIGALQKDLSDLDQLVRDLSSPDTAVGHFIVGSEEYDQVLTDIRGFQDSLHTFLTPKSDLGQAFYSSKLYDDIHSQVTQADESLAAIQRGEGAAGHAFASDEQYQTLVRQLSDLHAALADANSGKGRFAPLLRSDEDWRNLNKLLRSTDATLTALNAGHNQAGQLLASPQFYESLTGSLRAVADLLKQLREHPDTLQHYRVF